jgi:hypothetical protein
MPRQGTFDFALIQIHMQRFARFVVANGLQRPNRNRALAALLLAPDNLGALTDPMLEMHLPAANAENMAAAKAGKLRLIEVLKADVARPAGNRRTKPKVVVPVVRGQVTGFENSIGVL